jgi:hypothetical protein
MTDVKSFITFRPARLALRKRHARRRNSVAPAPVAFHHLLAAEGSRRNCQRGSSRGRGPGRLRRPRLSQLRLCHRDDERHRAGPARQGGGD